MDDTQIKRVLEALLLVSEKPLLIDQVRQVLGANNEVQPADIRRLLVELAEEYAQAQRGTRIVEVAEGFQLVTDPALAEYVTRLTRRVRTVRLTRPSLETLAIIAYRQPATRVEIEQVRGVDVGGVLETLLKLSLIRVLGRKETVGRPLLYGTTREFLDHFGLKDLDSLPSLEELIAPPPLGDSPLDKESRGGLPTEGRQVPASGGVPPRGGGVAVSAVPSEGRGDASTAPQTD